MSQRTEYRVVWKREGRDRSTRIYQSWSSAYRKAQGVLALEAVKDETTYETLPPLEQRPVIQTRPVGDWNDVEFQINEPSDGLKERMKSLYKDDRTGVSLASFPF